MFLRRLQVTNVRSIEQMEIDFTQAGQARKWTLLLAENGTGKTTLLRAIALVTAGGDALAELLGDVDGWIREGAKEARLEAEISTADEQLRQVTLVLRRGDSLSTLLERNRETVQLLEAAVKHSERNGCVALTGVTAG